VKNQLDILEGTTYCFLISETGLNEINVAANFGYILAIAG
jgi:hypothetical protein